MKRLLIAGLALVLFVPVCAFAQSAFTGTWKMDPTTVHQSGQPLVMSLTNGMYHCNCTPPINVKADGQDHAVTGHPGFNTVAIKVMNDHSIQETDKKDGKVVSSSTFTVASDGKTATSELTIYQNGSEIVNGKAAYGRVAKGAHGSNAVAGSWRLSHVVGASGNGLISTYKVDGKNISYSDPTGDSYTAEINGKAVPYTDGSGVTGTTVAVKREGKNTLRETFYRDGKVTRWDSMTVAADGKTMKTHGHNVKADRSMTFVSNKQ
ncbi:MAG: hypothetical protein EPN38_09220 [Rhodanobacteraceae bacterium]|nr:MAG: hypothetical protein EPN38_09220 [Rhodanobacteraceae bacterium]